MGSIPASGLDGGAGHICDVLFLVKNGSGFGHIRRAVLLSDELRKHDIESAVFSQASSLMPYGDAQQLRVVNFPLLDRLKTSAADEAFGTLFDAVAERLDPALLVEDTYPDHRYRVMPSLRGLPRLLVLRRLDPVSFDHLRVRGELAHYDHVLIAQSPEDFHAEPRTPASRALVESSGRFTFVGPVFHEPAADEVQRARRRFAEPGQPLVVVNAGSGGDQLNDAYADRLFTNVRRLADDCRMQGVDARFVLVLGPYYRGRAIPDAENVEVVGFEPELSALLQAATVAVIRPGHNVVHEALLGDAELVLVPGIPWLEGQHEFAESLGARVGATLVDVDDYGLLCRRVVDALRGDRRRRRYRPANGTATAAEAIAAHVATALGGPAPKTPECLMAFLPPRSLDERYVAHLAHDVVPADVPVVQHRASDERRPARSDTSLVRRLSRIPRMAEKGGTGIGRSVYVDVEVPAAMAPEGLAGAGSVVLLYPDEGDVGLRTRHWLAFAGDRRSNVVDVPLDRVRADIRRLDHLGWSLAQAAERAGSRGLLLDCTTLDEQEFRSYLVAVKVWLDKLGARPIGLAELGRRRVMALHGEAGGCR